MTTRQPPRESAPAWTYARGALLLTAVGMAWARFDPLSFQAQAVPYLRAAGAGLIGAAIVAPWVWRPQHPLTPTTEDEATGTYITGLPGSGKTGYALSKILRYAAHGRGLVCLSIKSWVHAKMPLLEYLPGSVVERTLLFAPASDRPLGLQFLRCYTEDHTERELLSDQTAELFTRLHPHMSENMRELIRMGALALLLWADEVGTEVTLWEAYRFFQEDAFRATVLATAPKPIRDAFGKDEAQKQTMLAVKRQLRRTVTSDNLLVALSQADGIDLWEVMRDEKILICETPTDVLGPGVSSFLCQAIASRLQMLTFKRPPGSAEFAIIADEFQRYTSDSFAHGLETAREYGVAWHLVHQTNEGQELGKAVHGAVNMCANQVYFTQAAGADCKRAAESLGNRWPREVFSELEKRHYLARLRIHGKVIYKAGITEDLPSPHPEIAQQIIARNSAGPSRAEILASIRKRKVEKAAKAAGDD